MALKFNLWTDNWKKAWDNNVFRLYISIILVMFITLILVYGRFLDFIEERPGSVLVDPFLNSFAPLEVTWFTFGIIYIK